MRILIVKLSSIGDVLMATPVAQALREQYPRAFIAWLVEEAFQDVVQGNPYLDEVLVWPRQSLWEPLLRGGRWGTLIRELGRFQQQLRTYRFEVALDLQGLLKSALLAWLSGAPRRLGPAGAREGSQLLYTERLYDQPELTRTKLYLGLIEPLVPFRDLPMTLPLGEGDRAFAGEFLTAHGVDEDTPLAALCPTTTRPQKQWVEDYWADLVLALGEQLGMRSVVLGGPKDRALAERLRAKVQERRAKGKGGDFPLLSAVGQTTLKQAGALIERAQVCMGVDTGLMHFGLAVGTPTIALFGSTSPRRLGDEPNVIVLNRHLSCAPCGRHPTCQGRYDCMRGITVEEVLTAAKQLLNRSG
ncbi:MAG TPA: glycosyltransferase family 9 protein [Armatimonadetes bacterium]|nr:glycosyltransferase family 9 protein [Armatimonadota bacterium]